MSSNMLSPQNAIRSVMEAATLVQSTPEMRTYGTPASPSQLRELGQVAPRTAYEYLYDSNLSSKDLISTLHALCTVGYRAYEDPANAPMEGGVYRKHEVSVGDIVPPKHEDVQDLMNMFSNKLDDLIHQCRQSDVTAICVWAHTVLTAIHPFPDGNGRTARALMEYIQYSMNRKSGYEATSARTAIRSLTPTLGEDHSMDDLNRMQYDFGLAPRMFPRGSSADLYLHSLHRGRPEKYFKAIKAKITHHILSVTDINYLGRLKPLKDFEKYLHAITVGNKYKTRPLLATAGQEIISRHLY